MAELKDLPILVMDCQATGTSVRTAHLLEVAWCAMRASDEAPSIESTLVALPPNVKIPKRVAQLTGITKKTLVGAPERAAVCDRLDEMLAAWTGAAALAHFARYERAFLSELRGRDDLDFICTHEITKRLVPGLPRKGLRAVAGYFGRTVDEAKRAGEHVDATIFVWREMVDELAAEGVHTLDELWRWLALPARKVDTRTYPLDRAKRLALPAEPGVYRMLARDGSVLYVGKATSLKDRVNSYFRQRRLAQDKMELVSQVHDLDITTTATALEAALLETDEIKRHAPRYNHQLLEREIVWASPTDFRDISATATGNHTLGPFSSRASCAHFADALDLLRGVGATEWFADANPEIIAGGVEAFRRKWSVADIDAVGFVALGARIFPTIEPREDDDEQRVTAVTEDSIVRYLEGSAAGAYRAVRRGEWLRALSTSVISWAPIGAPDTVRTLRLDGGCVTDGGAPHRALPNFDARTYDRLSVLLVELRRILRDGREIFISADHRDYTRDELLAVLSEF